MRNTEVKALIFSQIKRKGGGKKIFGGPRLHTRLARWSAAEKGWEPLVYSICGKKKKIDRIYHILVKKMAQQYSMVTFTQIIVTVTRFFVTVTIICG